MVQHETGEDGSSLNQNNSMPDSLPNLKKGSTEYETKYIFIVILYDVNCWICSVRNGRDKILWSFNEMRKSESGRRGKQGEENKTKLARLC